MIVGRGNRRKNLQNNSKENFANLNELVKDKEIDKTETNPANSESSKTQGEEA